MNALNLVLDRNPFSMAAPPLWWLEGLYVFDPEIVVMPSRSRMGVWWLTRRKRFTIGLTDGAISKDVKANETDTAMFLTHRVEPITDIVTPLGVWSLDRVLKWLWERDTWAEEDGPLDADGILKAVANGGSNFTKRVDAIEQEREERQRVAQREAVYHATGEGWRALQARKGQRILNAGTTAHTPPSLIIAGA